MAGQSPRPRLLVIGATGMFGHMACRTFGARFDLYATCRAGWATHPGLDRVIARDRCYEHVDVTDGERVRAVLREARPGTVVNAVGVIKQRPEAADPAVSIAVNALFPHRLAAWCGEVDAKLVHISTDCVFSGSTGNYAEADRPDPVDLYGNSKLLGEVTAPPHLTLRTSLIGRQLHGQESLLEWLVSARGGCVRGFTRAVFSGLTTHAMTRLIAGMLESTPGLTGLYQVAADPISKFDLLTRVNEALRLGVRIESDDSFACDRSLNGGRFVRDTGLAPPSWASMVADLADDDFPYPS